jgi:hypothetical protein
MLTPPLPTPSQAAQLQATDPQADSDEDHAGMGPEAGLDEDGAAHSHGRKRARSSSDPGPSNAECSPQHSVDGRPGPQGETAEHGECRQAVLAGHVLGSLMGGWQSMMRHMVVRGGVGGGAVVSACAVQHGASSCAAARSDLAVSECVVRCTACCRVEASPSVRLHCDLTRVLTTAPAAACCRVARPAASHLAPYRSAPPP